jgi:hypothetical protein
MSHPVAKSNIQGGIWPRMPKEFESYLFYKITNVNRFRNDLKEFISEITTGEQCEERLANIKSAAESGRSTKIPISGINVSFTQKGLQKVRLIECRVDQILNEITFPFWFLILFLVF